MGTQTVSTLNGVTQAAGASATLIVSANSLPNLLAISGYCNGTANTQYFLQLFNTNQDTIVITNGATPLYSWQVLGGDGFLFNFRPDGLDTMKLGDGTQSEANGLCLLLSTTEATLTLGTGGVTMDCEVDLDAVSGITPLNQAIAGDLTSNVASLAVAVDPSVRRLMSFNVKNSTGATGYLMLFGAVPTTGALPVAQWKITNGSRLLQNFNPGFFVQWGKPTNYTIHTGIYLYGSSTTQTFTATAATWNMLARSL